MTRAPSGRCRCSGQTPQTYAHPPTGRPTNPDLPKDTARYRDASVGPLFAFGHGLSYARFDCSAPSFGRPAIGLDGRVAASVSLTNRGRRTADEVVQLCIRDLLASMACPVAELRGFVRVRIASGETRRATFTLTADQFAVWSREGWPIESGAIKLMIGASSADIRARGSVTITAGRSTERPAAACPMVSSAG